MMRCCQENKAEKIMLICRCREQNLNYQNKNIADVKVQRCKHRWTAKTLEMFWQMATFVCSGSQVGLIMKKMSALRAITFWIVNILYSWKADLVLVLHFIAIIDRDKPWYNGPERIFCLANNLSMFDLHENSHSIEQKLMCDCTKLWKIRIFEVVLFLGDAF